METSVQETFIQVKQKKEKPGKRKGDQKPRTARSRMAVARQARERMDK